MDCQTNFRNGLTSCTTDGNDSLNINLITEIAQKNNKNKIEKKAKKNIMIMILVTQMRPNDDILGRFF